MWFGREDIAPLESCHYLYYYLVFLGRFCHSVVAIEVFLVVQADVAYEGTLQA